jgi:ATP-dependent protease HslVU (ClpYQ) peptidase subunit
VTTVAWDGGTPAFDSQTTCGNHRDLNVTKAVRHRGVIAAVAGTSALGLKFLDWFRSGMQGDPPEAGSGDDDSYWGLIVTKDRLLIWNSAGWLAGVNEPYTLGSGGTYALGAMASGADARTAVEIAARYDVNTGGKITVLSLH